MRRSTTAEVDTVTPPEPVTRVGFIIATANVARLADFYTTLLGFDREAFFEDPPYAVLSRNGMRLSLAEAGHPAPDLPGVVLTANTDQARPRSMIVLEVGDCDAVYATLDAAGARLASKIFRPPWGGARFFLADPDGNLIEVEQPA